MPSEPVFDVFAGAPDADPQWVGCAEGLSQAKALMQQYAAKKPGLYYVWDGRAAKVVAQIDTTEHKGHAA